MNYFKYFPHVKYTLTDDIRTAIDITAATKVVSSVTSYQTIWYDYVIQDGERPDTVAVNVYGDVAYTWVVLVLNNIFSLYDWPLTDSEFQAYIVEKYGSRSAASSSFYYYNAYGDIVDHATYLALDGADRGTPVSLYEVEIDRNEAKRRIRVVSANVAEQLQTELKKIL